LNRINTLAFYKRSTFLTNPHFQIKFSLIICSIIVISTLIYPVIIFDFFQIVSTNIKDAPVNLAEIERDLIFYLILIQAVITLLVFFAFIFFTHRIAGPMYKLKVHLRNISDGAPVTPLKFRNGDYFHDVAEEVSQFLDDMIETRNNDFEELNEISRYIDNLTNSVTEDKKPVLKEISRRLIKINSRYKTTF
jgi:signal transduction histidine kinase